MARLACVALIARVTGCANAPRPAGGAFLPVFRDAMVKLIAEDYAAALTGLKRAAALDPEDDVVTYLVAMAAAQRHDRTTALAWLRKLDAMASDLIPIPGDLLELVDDPEAQPMMAALRARAAAESRGATEAFRIPAPGVRPEGIAYDPGSRAFFVGSVRDRKIFRVRDGQVDELASGPLRPVLGLRVDPARRELWVGGEATTSTGYRPGDETARAEVTVLDVETGAPKRRYVAPDAAKHLFNDVAIADDGTAFITDSLAGAVWTIAPGGELRRLGAAGRFVYANGIAWDPVGRALLVADAVTTYRVAPATGEATPLTAPAGVSLAGLDGLYVAGDELIGVQNLAGVGRLIALPLAPGRAGVTGRRVLLADHPVLDAPTTAAIAPDGVYLLASSQIRSKRPDGPIIVLRVPLR
jgi:sugar lactone lactonase YvrE